MLRREFLIGAAASVAALPAAAAPEKAFAPDLWPPLGERSEFVAWMAANRGEDPNSAWQPLRPLQGAAELQ